MRPVKCITASLLVWLTAMLLGAGFSMADEPDEARTLADAFAAFQKKDYLLALEKAELLNRLFPESALNDVAYLLMARSSYKAGDNERAARTITRLVKEFPESGLNATIEEELLKLGARHQKGETLPPNKQLQNAAMKIRADRVALERAAAAKLEQERLAREKAEQERLAKEKAEAELRAKQLAAAEKAAKASIKIAIKLPESINGAVAGEQTSIPAEISNRGKKAEEFLLKTVAPEEYEASIVSDSAANQTVSSIKLAAGETFKGIIFFRVPPEKTDGTRASLTLTATSKSYADVSQQKSISISASAPLLRAVGKLSRTAEDSFRQLLYKVSVLNVGTMPARMLSVRVMLPRQLDFQGAADHKFRQEKDGTLIFIIDQLDPGKLSEIKLNVSARDSSHIGKALQGQVELINGQLQRKDIFTLSVTDRQGK